MFDDLKIVYLEDEPIVALDTSEHLKNLGFGEVKVVSRLRDAEALTCEDNFDVALFDINVDKGQTSLELGHQLASRGTKVIFASGNSSLGREISGESILFLDKPFSLTQLTSMLKQAANT
ncbi:Response regulator receiver protein [Sulfitobacter noctilucae]|uniref:response regulator n=1 Tax=Sulfitobacter noctilucae TaxID=1342302 RepID=UPI000469829E|nr:response regulator [Sulfitobacter noctilucae]KIN70975.1 Response regulator receiver protein [Sulfitobacter noctilucae]